MRPDAELEQELERLGRLLAPQSSLVDRVMARIDELPQRPVRAAGRRRWLAYSAVALTAAVASTAAAVLLAWQFGFARHPNPGPAPGQVATTVVRELKPVAAEQVAERMLDESRWVTATEKVVNLPNNTPVREVVRQEFVHVQWYDDQDQATMQVTIRKPPAVRMTMDVY
jgi:hypothetical protein